MFYTGVGNRNAPQEVLNIIYLVAQKLSSIGWVLRSGGAAGCDTAFETGAGNRKEIYYIDDATTEAMEIASQFHPAWNRLNPYVKKLHGRNAFQVLGRDLKTPSTGLICWTPDGCKSHAERTIKTGGTGTAISIADFYGVKISNLAVEEDMQKWINFLRKR